jgi:hypothetical protein
MTRVPLPLVLAVALAGCASGGADRQAAVAPSTGSDRPASQGGLLRADPLDGRTYAVTLRPEGTSDPGDVMTDRLVFADGLFESTLCTKAGFRSAPYATRMVAGGFAFDVECDSPTMGHTVWHGVADAAHVNGTVTRTAKDGDTPILSRFSGDILR